MAGDWNAATVADLQESGVLLVEDGNHGEYRPRPEEFTDEGVAFIRAADMVGGRVLFESASKINEIARRRIKKGVGEGGDVLLSHKGTVGKVALVQNDAPPFVCSPQTTFWRTLDQDRLDRGYLYAFLRSPLFHAQLAGRAGETDMAAYVSLTSQRGLSVSLPPIYEQRAIAYILGTLDDKIELNRRMGATLEAMARALFKSWFVDFDPVRAKMEGRDPGLPSHLAALFSDRFVESEHGEIPEGWSERSVGEVLELAYGKALKASERIDGSVPVYGSGGVIGFHNEALVDGPSIVVGRKGTVGSLYWEDRSFFPIDTVFYVKPKAPLTFCYYHLQTLGLDRMNTDAAVPGLNRNNVYRLPVPWSSNELCTRFDEIVMPFRQQMRTNSNQNHTLEGIRDALLPKLISGELRVKDAETFLERVL